MWWVVTVASEPPGRSASSTLSTRRAGSSQWNAVAAMTRSNGSAGERPLLERGGDDLDAGEAGKVPPGDRRQVRAKLHGDDLAAPLGQGQGRLPGSRPDLQHPGSRSDPRQLGQVAEQRRRISRPHPVVQLGSLIEGRPEQLPILLGHDRAASVAFRF
jgi:hypothetical protein